MVRQGNEEFKQSLSPFFVNVGGKIKFVNCGNMVTQEALLNVGDATLNRKIL
ncbi:MAG TPA: hypothetical protein VHH33_02215 [Nitrososphaeraceae archaeon]|nr:hypothetical protein [Nitrososphaeraceae archaeon]